MNKEIHAINKNNTWELTTLPEDHQAIGVKWIYKTKRNAKGEVEKYKARLIAKGYKQQYEIDYEEVFVSIARLETVRLLLSSSSNEMEDFTNGCQISIS